MKEQLITYETARLAKEKDLALVRLNNDLGWRREPHYNVWIRILFIDTDSTLHGRVERVEKGSMYEKGQMIQLPTDNILDVFSEDDGRDWCYSDSATRCHCSGLCRNK